MNKLSVFIINSIIITNCYAIDLSDSICEDIYTNCGRKDWASASIILAIICVGFIFGTIRTRVVIFVLIGIPILLAKIFHPILLMLFFPMLFLGPSIVDWICKFIERDE